MTPPIRPPLVPPADLARDGDAWLSAGGGNLFRVDLDPTRLAGAWVEVTAAVATDAEVARPRLVLDCAGDGTPAPLPFACSARGVGRWIGLLPPDLSGIWFEPIGTPGRFRIEDFAIRTPSWLSLVRRAFGTAPLDTARMLGWRAAGKRLRARHRLGEIIRRSPAATYQGWVRANETVSPGERAMMLELIGSWTAPPLISVVMPVYNPSLPELEAAISSVRRQIYPHWELCIADDRSPDPAVRRALERAAASDPRIRVSFRAENGNISAASNSAVALATGPYAALMDHDDLLPEHALFYVAREVTAHPEADLVYSDEDKVDEAGRRYDPHFKSDWNEELFLAQNYVNHLTVIRTELIRRVGGFRVGYEGSQDHDLLLRVLDHTADDRIRHIPRVLYHWRNYKRSGSFSSGRIDQAISARQRALEDHLARRGIAASIDEDENGFNRVRRRLPAPALKVSLIVPTRDAAHLLEVCTRGILAETDYPDLELIVIDNESREPETLALFGRLSEDPRVRILPLGGPFNFSAMNNRAVAAARGDVVGFVNNDIEVIEPGWLAEMVALLGSDGVGAVGAKLLYPDNYVQHAGVLLGIGGPNGVGGVAGHSHLGARHDWAGYYNRLVLPQYLSAVTAACMVVRREAFLAVGGFDEVDLKVAFNDVDLCLKLRRGGYKIAWTPYAVLYHHESASRGSDQAPGRVERFNREIDVMLERWGETLRRDPYYNPNLSLVSGHFIPEGLGAQRMPEIKPMFRPDR